MISRVRRLIVPGVFLALAYGVAVYAAHAVGALVGHPDTQHGLLVTYALLRTAVALAFAVFTFQRDEPIRRSREMLAFAACTVAMGGVLVISPPSPHAPANLLAAGDAVAVAGGVWLLASVLALGRCFGVLPEARGFVLRGPYRLVRHPVYLGEIVALAGLVLAAPVAWNVVVLVLFVVAQVIRTHLEERALREAFPQYAAYTQTTGRLLPRRRRIAKPLLGPASLLAGGAK